MNTEFMEEYYYLKYKDLFLLKIMEESKECQELYREIMRMEGMVEEAMQKMGAEYLQLHGNLYAAKGRMDEMLFLLSYLKGAADREKMLE